MSDTEVFAAALALPWDERVRLADALVLSLRGEDADCHEAWAEELSRRVREVKDGSASLVGATDVFTGARERLRARRK